ncbi:hypothetical protein RND81_07G080900 [Saponaria officinalis]|uniref:WAT1-related protein n=1 Tax=Saponaria officinalis TaxID=3572 RepID=A0AAW1JN38_SAPOF
MLLFMASDSTWLFGCLSLLASMLLWSSWLILQVAITKCYPDALSFSAWLSFLAMFQAAAIAFFTVDDRNAWIITSPLELTSLYFSGVVGSGVMVFVQAWCISRRGPFFTSVFAPLSTVVTTLLECIILHESLYLGSLLGALGVIIGLYIVLWGKAREMKGTNPSVEGHQVQTMQDDMPREEDLEQPLLTTTTTTTTNDSKG